MAIQLNTEKLNSQNFASIIPKRIEAINAAPETMLNQDYQVNRLAKALHPAVQHVKIAEIRKHGKDAKSFILVPDMERGTKELAYFSAGQYLSVLLTIGHSKLWKPYSICSGPSDAVNGSYTLTIKRVSGGFASEFILENCGRCRRKRDYPVPFPGQRNQGWKRGCGSDPALWKPGSGVHTAERRI